MKKPNPFLGNTAAGTVSKEKSALSSDAHLRRLHSAELFGGSDQIIIEHAGREYRLRVTNNGKLILTA